MVSNTMYGFAGKILKVDLTGEQSWSEPLDQVLTRLLFGEGGLAAGLMKDMDWALDPYDPGNFLVFSVEPLTGIQPMLFALRGICEIAINQSLGWGPCQWILGALNWSLLVGRSEKPV